MLVALTLVSLLGTLLVQGLGFFAGRYEAVKRMHRQADLATMRQHWFETTVRGIVPVGVWSRRFRGEPAGFVATTLQPLAAEPAMPSVVRWRVVADQRAVDYFEEADLHAAASDRPASAPAVAWRLPVTAKRRLSFQYADDDGGWHDQWPPPEAAFQWTPSAIRLVAGERAMWMARVEAAPYPVPNEAMYR